jgi:hypothetical protein
MQAVEPLSGGRMPEYGVWRAILDWQIPPKSNQFPGLSALD